jgi:hypothetical protein
MATEQGISVKCGQLQIYLGYAPGVGTTSALTRRAPLSWYSAQPGHRDGRLAAENQDQIAGNPRLRRCRRAHRQVGPHRQRSPARGA